MSLKIWLPLNGDIKNKGLSNIRFESNTSITYNESGKLGFCNVFNGSVYYVAHNASIPTTSWSVAAWIYPTSSSASGHQYVVGLNTSTSSDFLFNLCHNANKFSVRIAGTTYSVSDTLTLNKWYHVAATYDGVLKIYINGELSTTVTSPVTPVAATDIYIGTRGGIAGNFYGNLNDIRIYDETLSPAEIKAISQGLIAHYKLDDPQTEPTTNLSTIQFVGSPSGSTSTWGGHTTTVTRMTRTNQPIPSKEYTHIDITYSTDIGSGGGYGISIQTINILPSTKYYYSVYLKTSDISYAHANFLYIYEYPGSASSPGTKIREFGIYDINNKEYIGDGWYRIWGTFTTTENANSIKYSFYTYPNKNITYDICCWQVEKTDHMTPYVYGTRNITRIVDSSGYGNHGSVYKYDSTGFCKVSDNTAKHLLSTMVNAGNINNSVSGLVYIYGNCTLKTPEQLTVAFWCKPIAGYNNLANGIISLTNNEIGTSAGQDYNTAPMNHRDGTIDINSVATVTTIRPTIAFTANEWHHYVITYDGRYGKVHKDGVLSDTKDMGSNKTLNDMKGIVIGFSRAGGVYRKVQAYYSDFRLYVTALSATDIESLYKVSARITKNNKFQISEINEDLDILKPYVYKSGVIESKGSPNPNLLIHTNTKTYGLGYAVAYSGGSITLDNTELFNGKPTIKVNPSSSNTSTGAINQYNGEVNLTSGKTYCYSCWIKSTDVDTWNSGSLGHYQTYANGTAHNRTIIADILQDVPANKWTKVATVFKPTVDCNFRSYHIYFANTSQAIWIADAKLEEGSVPTDWVPNINDEDYNYASFIEIENDTCKIQKSGYITADEFIEM